MDTEWERRERVREGGESAGGKGGAGECRRAQESAGECGESVGGCRRAGRVQERHERVREGRESAGGRRSLGKKVRYVCSCVRTLVPYYLSNGGLTHTVGLDKIRTSVSSQTMGRGQAEGVRMSERGRLACCVLVCLYVQVAFRCHFDLQSLFFPASCAGRKKCCARRSAARFHRRARHGAAQQ